MAEKLNPIIVNSQQKEVLKGSFAGKASFSGEDVARERRALQTAMEQIRADEKAKTALESSEQAARIEDEVDPENQINLDDL